MAKYAYVVHQVIASRRNKPTETKILSEIGGLEGGLIDILGKMLDERRGEVDCNEGSESAHRIESSYVEGGSIIIEGMVGSYGVSGKALHLDTGAERPFDTRTANLNPIRAQLFVPEDEREALLFCERVSQRTFRQPLEKGILKLVEKNYGVTFTISSYIDKKAWEDFLRDGKIGSITAIYKSTRSEDISPRRGKSQDLQISVGGPVASRLSPEFKQVLRRMTSTKGPAHYTLEEYPELLPNDRENYRKESLEVEINDGNSKRVIVVERNSLPLFTYPLETRLSTSNLQNVWREHASEILSDRGLTLDV